MKIEFTNSFDKQLSTINDEKLLNEISGCVKNVIEAGSLREIHQLKKLKGFKSAYRIKTGNYRIGLFIEKDLVVFSAVLHRKDIYRKFP